LFWVSSIACAANITSFSLNAIFFFKKKFTYNFSRNQVGSAWADEVGSTAADGERLPT
jgi:hypothetical protein